MTALIVPVRYRRLAALCCWVTVMLLLLAGRTRHPAPAPPQPTAAAPGRCARLLRLSTCRHRWESGPPPAEACQAQPLSAQQVRGCVQPPPGQPAPRIVFVGDSRIRKIFHGVLDQLGLPLSNRTEPIPVGHDPHFISLNMTTAPPYCQEVFKITIRPQTEHTDRKMFFCSQSGGGDWLRLEYFWRPYLSRSYLATVSELADRCDRRPERCPRLVVLDSGLWYALRFSLTEWAPAADWVARYRQQLAALLPHLRRLAAASHVLWKLDEPQFRQETQGGKPGILMGTLTAIQAAVYSQTAGIGNLTVWSAMLPDTIFYYRNVCWTGRQRAGFQQTPLFKQCGDMHHVGSQLIDRHVTQLVNWLCRDSGELPPGHCCRSDS
ncbi:hypothetical protein FJT64_020903 [Amphibalanus amphitrite]|uniref:Uncharacterized protein n=1 Tax=Amphibalanus amphitrite TaxID=1232801 RepID=A0A6A4WR57_AMPAM|nr:hypothetical protein FJT64_020903 [Amphibalanus amphitrite]